MYASSLALVLGAVRAATLLHELLLVHLFQLPLAFFDTTPTGRVMNRVGKDIDTIDVTLPFTFQTCIATSMRTFVTVLVVAYVTPLFLAAFAPLVGVYLALQVVEMEAYNKV